MNKLIIPKTYVKDLDAPLIFLAGPIRSAPNWQDETIKILLFQKSDLIIASPRRGVRNEIAEYIIEGNENYFPRQRAWERHYLKLASKKGAILFWLPGEEKHDCQKVYGAMTRIELGQWMTNYRHDNSVKFCVGSDGKFPEMEIIEYDLSLDSPNKKIFKTLEETCVEALRLALE
ncbi:MAG: hypothetical protein AABX99_03980 [Nanoarchaeota archaeon]